MLAWLFLRERVSLRKMIAIGVSIGGVLLIVSSSGEAGRLWGNILSVGMGITYALTVVLARWERDVPTTEATLLGVLIVAAVSLPMANLQVSAGNLAILAVFGCFQMGVALILFTTGIRLIPAADAGLISVLESVVAPLWVWLLFAENPGPLTLAGGAVVIAAVTWAALGEREA